MIPYLLASLPAPRPSEPPAIDPQTFLDRCRGFVSDERWRDLAELLASATDVRSDAAAATPERSRERTVRSDGSRDPVARAWCDLSAQIDDAVAIHRGANARRDPGPFLARPSGHRVDVAEAVERAFAEPDPGARERALDDLRWRLADELSVGESDGFAALYARAAHLSLAWRRARWDAAAGWTVLETCLRDLEAPHA